MIDEDKIYPTRYYSRHENIFLRVHQFDEEQTSENFQVWCIDVISLR